MSIPQADPLLDRLVSDFGGNYVFAVDLLEQYRVDRGSVEPSWRRYFDEALGVEPEPETPPVTVIVGEAPAWKQEEEAEAPSRADDRLTLQRRDIPAAPVGDRSRAVALTSILPGDILQPIRGGAVRLVENMEASLSVPTATSARTMPVRTVEENRRLLNKHRQASGQAKISFTHIVAWAILRALDTFPRLNDAYAVVDGEAHRIQRDQVRLGIAVDVQRKDGSRTLLVPNIKDARVMDFAELVKAFDDLVGRSRKGAISPDDFMGTTVSLTNPGTVGTTTSAPRLMPGQGLIVATGALDYPAEYRSMAPRTLGLLGISKVMTVTSTYDHRIIQGAESGLFLSRMEELLKGEDGFYERLFQDLGLPHRPVRWEVDSQPALLGGAGSREEVEKQAKVLQLIHAYRVRGHLVADLDPLDRQRAPHRDLDPATYGLTLWDLDREFLTGGYTGRHSEDRATLREILDTLRETYCGTIGVEYMYIADPERKAWLQKRMESARNYPALDVGSKRRVLEKLVAAESFERFLHARYIGHKRFSLEGGEALVPLLDRILNDAAQRGMREVVLGMSHRGRLNVLANTVGKPLSQIFAEFEGSDPSSYQGSGDVKYHLGATGTHHSDTGETIEVALAPNPSHLEFVNPVVEGMVRARQDAIGDREHSRILPLLLHGDAAFAGQGVVAETMHLSGLHGYRTGGTIHVIVNNQIGFTTLPEDARSSTYATDVAKMVHAPAFHVNGDDPEAVAYVAGLALEYRQKFRQDVVIDLVCYRRWGHNETDEPSYTQPLMYSRIKEHPSVATLYGDKLVREGVVTGEERDRLWAEGKAAMQSEEEPPAEPFAAIARREPVEPAPVDAAAMRGRLRTVLEALGSVPDGFEIHPKLVPFVRKRAELLEGRGDVDWATAESLAWGTLLLEGVPVRLSGQDSGRGTFSQRHAVLSDARTGEEHVPLHVRGPGRGALRRLRLAPLRGRGHGLRVRLLGGRAPHPGHVGGAVRRLRERGPGHHRPVPLRVRAEVGTAQRPGPAPAPRSRGPGAGALLGAHRALPDPLRRGQHACRLPLDARVLLPPPALAGARPDREAPRRLHPQEPPAEPPLRVLADRAGGGPLRARPRRPRRRPRARAPGGPVQREGLLRPGGGPRGGRPRRRGPRAPGAALLRSLPASCRRPCDRFSSRGRARVGPGGAPEHGGLALRPGERPRRRRRRRGARRCATWGGPPPPPPLPGSLKTHLAEQEALVREALQSVASPAHGVSRGAGYTRPDSSPSPGGSPPRLSLRQERTMTTTADAPPRQREVLEAAVIRFAGDSGDGMQITGNQFTNTAALFGNDLATFPDYPAEIRAPAGTLPGVSGSRSTSARATSTRPATRSTPSSR